jgi:hypothetical protein
VLVVKVWKIGRGVIGFCVAMYNTIVKEMLVRLLLFSFRFSSFLTCFNIMMLTSVEAKNVQVREVLPQVPGPREYLQRG